MKLGGSLLTDKTGIETIRPDVAMQVCREIAQARQERPSLSLLLGHGGGSFGHVSARQYGTRQGVGEADGWRGFALVHDAMQRLNAHLRGLLLANGLPAMSFPPALLARCANGRITHINAEPIQQALANGLLPVIFGDVAFDEARGGTIVSTEQVMAALAGALRPSWLLLAGETAGVYDESGAVIPAITPANYDAIRPALGGSRGTDVTGGMVAKVQEMLALMAVYPDLQIRIFSGLERGLLARLLANPELAVGTRISQ
ncbi:MAG: isopentenyl phosphate kinase [Anaerolineae bacterium]